MKPLQRCRRADPLRLAEAYCGKIQAIKAQWMVFLVFFAIGSQIVLVRNGHETMQIIFDSGSILVLLNELIVIDTLVDRRTERVDRYLTEAEQMILRGAPGRVLMDEEQKIIDSARIFNVSPKFWFEGLYLIQELPAGIRDLYGAQVETTFRFTEHRVVCFLAGGTVAICLIVAAAEIRIWGNGILEAIKDFLIPTMTVVISFAIAAKSHFFSYRKFDNHQRRAESLCEEWMRRSQSSKTFKAHLDPQFESQVRDLWQAIRSARCASPPCPEFVWRWLRRKSNSSSVDMARRLSQQWKSN